MALKLWPVERLLYAVVSEHHAHVTDESLPLTDEQRALLCRDCGHARSQHPGGYPDHAWNHCIATVEAHGTRGYWREPCECWEWVAQ